MVKVSVIVPCYNAERYLERCLGFLLAQTLPEVEFIFVDDGSNKDDTARILESFKQRDPRIKVIHQSNKGLGGARNTGIAAAQGEYIGFLDADDGLTPNFFEVLYTAAERHDADIAWTGCLKIIEGRKNRYMVNFTEEAVLEGREQIRTVVDGVRNQVWMKIYRRTLFSDSRYLFLEHRYYEDVFFTPPVMFAANRVVTVPGAYYLYTPDKTSITRRKPSPKIRQDKYEASVFARNFFLENNMEVPRVYRRIRKRQYCIGPVCLIKVKDCGKYNEVLLFDFIPVWRRKNRASRTNA